MYKFKLICCSNINDGLNTTTGVPFKYNNCITYLTNGYYKNNIHDINTWNNCRISMCEWFSLRCYIYLNDDLNHSYTTNTWIESIILYIHYIFNYKLTNILAIIGGLYSIINIIISLIK